MRRGGPDLSIHQLAVLLAVTRQRAHQILKRGHLDGHRLIVGTDHGRGGAGGKVFRVRLDSLPAALQARARELWPELATPAASVPALPPIAKPARRKMRADAGRPRMPHGLNRLVKKGRLTRDQAVEIARRGREFAKDVWGSEVGPTGWRQVSRYTTNKLRDFCHEAGVPGAELLNIEATRTYVSHFDLRKHRKFQIFKHDAKRFHDAQPAVRRDWSMLDRPLEVLIGDGTALDVRFLRPDSSECKVWLILWMDGKTNRLFGNAYARPKGSGVRQEHTAYSFALLAEQFGLPEAIIYDGGGEYAWLDLLGAVARLVKTLPYSARAKKLEPGIRVLVDRHISLIPGFVGADRMRKKTQSVGRPTEPFPGSVQELFAAIGAAIDDFNATPQLGGLSPNEAWRAALDTSWRPNRVDVETMMEQLARCERRKVQRGAISIQGVSYTSVELQDYSLEGEFVTVRVPIVTGIAPSVLDPAGRFVSLVHAQEALHPLDTAGARQAARMNTRRTRSARALARPAFDIPAHQRRFLEQHPPPDDALDGEVLELDGELGRAVAARRRLHGQDAAPPALPAPAEDNEAAVDRQLFAELEAKAEARRRAEAAEEEELRAEAREAVRKARAMGID